MRPALPLCLSIALAGLGSAACGDDSAPQDAGLDGGAGDAAPDAAPDVGPSDGAVDGGPVDSGLPDTGPRDVGTIDAGPGGENLIGTSLEGITIEWSQTVELCTRWMESAPLSDELARKVHVSLPPHFRPSLGDGHLGQAQLLEGRVRRGPLSVDQLDVAGHVSQPRLTHYELRDPSGDSSLSATIDHELDDGGILVEFYSVYRQRGDTRPVRFDEDYGEAGFAYVTPGGTDGLSLERCGGEQGLEPALEVVAATNGNRSATIIRQLRTQETFAGSYPVQLESTILLFSDRPWERFAASGFWAHTYSAEHHNWFEDSIVDFTRDLKWYETVYEPYLDGRVTTPQMLTRARLRELNAWDANPRAELEWLDLSTGQTQSETWTIAGTGQWQRVDASSFLRGLQMICANGQVLSFTDYELSHGLQLLTCPDSSALGFVAQDAVPISFMEEPVLVGTSLGAENLQATTIDGRPGYLITVGSHLVEISKGTNGYFYMTIKTSAGVELQTFLTQPIDLHAMFDPTAGDEVLSGQGGTDVSMRLVRRWAGQGVGESSIFAPVSFELSFGGQTFFVDTWDRLAYTNSHHNWADGLEARTDELTLFWLVRYDNGPLRYTVRAVRTSDGQELLPETEITLD